MFLILHFLSPYSSIVGTEQLKEKITAYSPGTICKIGRKPGYEPPENINIGVFGLSKAGKSAWINSIMFAYSGKSQCFCQITEI